MMHGLYDHLADEIARVRALVCQVEEDAGDPAAIVAMKAAANRASWSLQTMDVCDQMNSVRELQAF